MRMADFRRRGTVGIPRFGRLPRFCREVRRCEFGQFVGSGDP
jgi:hypothetical protein